MRVKHFLLAILILVLLSACGGSATETVVAPPTAVPTITALPTVTVMPTPSTPLAILLIPADMDKTLSDLYQKTVYDLAQASGFRFQVRNEFLPTDLADPTLKVVIVLPPDPGIASIAPTAPNVQFLAVNIPNLTPGGNLSVLAGEAQGELPAFMAGYVAAMISDEYHIGMMIPKDNPDAQRAFNAFNNGMIYYCGLCRTFYMSTIGYPTYVEVPADEKPSRYGGYANVLINDRKVYSIYVYPTLADADFLSYIGTQGVFLIGTSMPNPRPGGWVMTIRPDTIKAIQLAWPNLIAGQGGVNVQSPLGIADVDSSILTPGKLRLAQETLEALLAGRILPTSP
ncbi:hypothetical protein ANAEL_02322 [Anaerolineales bacterium]|nr:hypothetical protein ANAEL_02322 [Anaerolineales bacterium]